MEFSNCPSLVAGAAGGWAELWPSLPWGASLSLTHVLMGWDTLAGSPCRDSLDVSRCSLLDHAVGSWGAHRDPFVVSWGCLCFPAPLGASARAGAQPDFLQHPPPQSLGAAELPWPPQETCSSPGSHLAAVPVPAVTPSGFARGIWCNTAGWFGFPEPSGASLALQGFLTISHTNLCCFSTSQSLFPEKISCHHPGVSLLQLKPFGGFHVSLWEFLLLWRFCFHEVFISTCKVNLIYFILDVSKENTLPRDSYGDREAKTWDFFLMEEPNVTEITHLADQRAFLSLPN